MSCQIEGCDRMGKARPTDYGEYVLCDVCTRAYSMGLMHGMIYAGSMASAEKKKLETEHKEELERIRLAYMRRPKI